MFTPIVNHPGWLDDRHCYNGLWDYPDDQGEREIYQPLAIELRKQTGYFKRLFEKNAKHQTETSNKRSSRR